MTLALSTAVINDRLQALTRAIDGGSGPGLLRIYDGTRPATGAAITTQQKLVEQPFADPSTGSISGTTLTLALGASVLASKTGNASWARIVASDGTFVADMDAGASGSGREVELSAGGTPTTQLYEGGVVAISLATLVEA
ncbi:hypothetical protein [Cupriavidus sp. IK-TO18]|uniref:hypothetical protein n=1 Tax=Cupriavidus sp. IK-TO18 TaxID=2782182 RepID=UPI00189989C8|nr:hypothetical protein [Cupriavidus sp. IK-TO18]MBF6987262.1 hypothetical protein [Cupriavidus sp. IK-TO18]